MELFGREVLPEVPRGGEVWAQGLWIEVFVLCTLRCPSERLGAVICRAERTATSCTSWWMKVQRRARHVSFLHRFSNHHFGSILIANLPLEYYGGGSSSKALQFQRLETFAFEPCFWFPKDEIRHILKLCQGKDGKGKDGKGKDGKGKDGKDGKNGKDSKDGHDGKGQGLISQSLSLRVRRLRASMQQCCSTYKPCKHFQ